MRSLSRKSAFVTLSGLFWAGQVLAEPKLQLGDRFLPFVPGLFGYGIDRGDLSAKNSFSSYGVTNLIEKPAMKIMPWNDLPDVKKRVRLTLSETDPVKSPNGDIEVFGTIYTRNPVDPTLPAKATAISEVLSFQFENSLTTTAYFDEVTEIKTAGIGMDVTLETEFWSGHEQEMTVSVSIDEITDSLDCIQGWLVYFNGQAVVPDWDPLVGRCTAALIPGAFLRDGVRVSNAAYRGIYFGIDPDDEENDAFFHFDEDGFVSIPKTRKDWIESLPYEGYFFDVDTTNDPLVRPIVAELQRQSDLQIVDTARFMLTVAVSPSGEPLLLAIKPETENPGAIAQLTESGLDRLEPTHAATLPYPIAPEGKQPRLSQSAIALEEHSSPEATVNLLSLSEEGQEYWIFPNPAPKPNEGEFAGHLAYEAILDSAVRAHRKFNKALAACSADPNPPACRAALKVANCVDRPPKPDNFRIRIDKVNTYFDPARPEDALVIGDVTDMDLSFADNSILADFTMEGIQGWLEASIDPENIRIEWDKPLGDPCFLKPSDRVLSDFWPGSVDYKNWMTCKDLSFSASSASLDDPIVFGVTAKGELIETPFASSTPTVRLSGVNADPGLGICGEDWLSPLIKDDVLAWKNDVTGAIEQELVTSPGEDEALRRLLSPYELGIPGVDDPPPGTPPYDVHPLGYYDLSATVGKTAGDPFGARANAVDGLYVPYLTKSSPIDAIPFSKWFCPFLAGQTCGLAGPHEPMFPAGVDPNGDPFDVALNYTTAHINQALWTHARRADRLGSPTFPARLDMAETAIVDLAATLGYNDVVDSLSALGSGFGLRFHQDGAPFTVITDANPPKLIYVTPNVVLELTSIASDGTETVAAKFLVDVVDRNLQLSFRTGGGNLLEATWGEPAIFSLTSTFASGCYDTVAKGSCDDHLRTVVGLLFVPELQATLLELIETAPALQLFDSGQESDRPRQLKNPRTFLSEQGVALVADLCKPGTQECE